MFWRVGPLKENKKTQGFKFIGMLFNGILNPNIENNLSSTPKKLIK